MTAVTTAKAADAKHARPVRVYRPLVDIIERADELLIVADLPGASAESIDVHYENGELSIHGQAAQRQSADLNYLRHEYGVGDFRREFQISETIDANRITASFEDGVLTLHLPKVEAVKPRKIEVRGGA